MRLGLAAASLGVVLAFTGCGESNSRGKQVNLGGSTPSGASKPFGTLPQLEPGRLSGRLYCVVSDDPECRLHVYDFATGADEALGSVGKPCGFLRNFTASPDGRKLAWRDEVGRIALLDLAAASVRVLGQADEVGQLFEEGVTQGPVFSPDSSRIAWCEGGEDAHLVIAETSDGTAPRRGPDGCRAAFTAQGLAELRDGRVFVEGGPLEISVGTEAPYQLVATADGTRFAVVSHGLFETRVHGVVDVYDLEGNPVARYVTGKDLGVDGMTLMFSIQNLSPTAGSALVYWGCIVKLAPFTQAERFPLLYGDDVPLGLIAYSPDGRYAVMPWEEYVLIPTGGFSKPPPKPAAGAVVFDGESFEPLYNLPMRAQNAVWVP